MLSILFYMKDLNKKNHKVNQEPSKETIDIFIHVLQVNYCNTRKLLLSCRFMYGMVTHFLVNRKNVKRYFTLYYEEIKSKITLYFHSI